MGRMSLYVLSVILFSIAIINAQTTYNGFEDNTVGGWYLFNSATTTLEVADGGASSTTKSLKLAGGQGRTLEGAALNITTISPTSLSFWVKVNAVANIGGVMFGSGTDATQVAIEFRFRSSGDMAGISSTGAHGVTTYVVDTWYNIRMDITFSQSVYALYIDGVLRESAVPFRNTGISSFNTVLFVSSQSLPTVAAYIDEIYIGCPNNCGGKTCNTSTGVCTCGVEFCGIDCSNAATSLTLNTAVSGTLSTSGTRNFYFDPQGKSFDIVLSTASTVGLYWRQPVSQCAGLTFNTYTDMVYSYGAGSPAIVNISACTVLQYSTGAYSIAISNTNTQASTYTLTVVPGLSNLVNARGVTRKIWNNVANGFGTYAITVPSTTNPITLQYTLSGPTTSFSIFARPNSCPTHLNPVPADVNVTRSVSQYTSPQIPVTGGTTYYFLVTSSTTFQYDVTFTASLSNCDTYCSGNGVCYEGQCACYNGWRGTSCDARRCPNDCSGKGTCSNDGVCTCDAGYAGVDCACSAASLTIGTASATSLAAATFRYFSVDVSNSKSGLSYSLNTTGVDVYWGVGSCSADTLSGASYPWKTRNAQLTDCLINQYGTKWIVGLRVSSARDVALTVNTTDWVKLENNKDAVSITNNIAVVYDVPVASKLEISVTTFYSYSSNAFFYLANSSCPSSTNNILSASFYLTNGAQRTIENVPAGRYWFLTTLADTPTIKIINSNCDLYCSGNGVCLNNQCSCNSEYTGNDCQNKKCTNNCNNRGTCNNGVCTCDANYGGPACECYAPRLSAGQSVPINTTYSWAYYSVDLTNYPSGLSIESTSTVPTYYWGMQCATSTSSSSWIVSSDSALRGVNNCQRFTYGTSWILAVYNSYTSGQSFTLRARTASLENLKALSMLNNQPGEWYFDVPAGTKSVTLNVTSSQSTNSFYGYALYITTNNTCVPFNTVASSSTYINTGSQYVVTVKGSISPGRYFAVYEGWYAYSIKVSMANCDSTCNNAGTCVDNVCVCNSGYSGASCETVVSCTSNCNFNGDCIGNNLCQCYSGYTGSTCSCRLMGTLSPSNTTFNVPLTSTIGSIIVEADASYSIVVTNPSGYAVYYSTSTDACGTATTFSYSDITIASRVCSGSGDTTNGRYFLNLRTTTSGSGSYNVRLVSSESSTLSATATSVSQLVTSATSSIRVDTTSLKGYKLTITPDSSSFYYYSNGASACDSANTFASSPITISRGLCSGDEGSAISFLQLRSYSSTSMIINVTLDTSDASSLTNNVPAYVYGSYDTRYFVYENTQRNGFFLYVSPTRCNDISALYLRYNACPSASNYTMMYTQSRCREATNDFPALATLTVAPALTGTYYIMLSPNSLNNMSVVAVPVREQPSSTGSVFTPFALISLLLSSIIVVVM